MTQHVVPLCACLLWCLVLLASVVPSRSLPGEAELARQARIWMQKEAGTPGRRAPRQQPTRPPCPVHPKPLPQEFINSEFVPDPLRSAFKLLDQMMPEIVVNQSIRAMSAGVVYDQELIWHFSSGLVNPNDPNSRVTADTPFRVGSISKAITNLMLLKLRDAGKVVLDDPVQKTVPEFRVKSYFKNATPITWRSLASQNSGLQGSVPCNFFTLTEPLFNDGCEISNAEAWRRLSQEDVIAPMYSKAHYADSSFAVIGRALESVLDGGMKYEDYVMNEMFKPLGMVNSFFELTSERAKQVPPGYFGPNETPSFVAHADLHWARPTGQIYSSVRDLQKILSLFFQGDQDPLNKLNILPSSLREMLQIVTLNDDAASGYSLPWEVYYSGLTPESQGRKYWLITKTGGLPGYVTTVFMIPEIKLGVIVQTNGNPFPFAWPILWNTLFALEQTLTDYALPPPMPNNLTVYEGVYVASALLGLMTANLTFKVVPAEQQGHYVLQAKVSSGLGPSAVLNTTWVGGNTFQLHFTDDQMPCLDVESNWNDLFVYFHLDWLGNVYSVTMPGMDPFYGWTFYKQQPWWKW